jgi:hypothetical protein
MRALVVKGARPAIWAVCRVSEPWCLGRLSAGGLGGGDALLGVAGVIGSFFTVVGVAEIILFGQGSGGFVTAVKSMIVSGRIS